MLVLELVSGKSCANARGTRSPYAHAQLKSQRLELKYYRARPLTFVLRQQCVIIVSYPDYIYVLVLAWYLVLDIKDGWMLMLSVHGLFYTESWLHQPPEEDRQVRAPAGL